MADWGSVPKTSFYNTRHTLSSEWRLKEYTRWTQMKMNLQNSVFVLARILCMNLKCCVYERPFRKRKQLNGLSTWSEVQRRSGARCVESRVVPPNDCLGRWSIVDRVFRWELSFIHHTHVGRNGLCVTLISNGHSEQNIWSPDKVCCGNVTPVPPLCKTLHMYWFSVSSFCQQQTEI